MSFFIGNGMGDPDASRLDGDHGNAVILFFKEISIGGS